MNEMKLASNNTCTGCGACVAACTHKALQLKYDVNGFLRPELEAESCVQCGVCNMKCPVCHPDIIKFNSHTASNAYSSWTENEEICKQSTSGGVFSQIAIDFLEDNSFVYGACLNEDNTCDHIEVNSGSDLHKIRGTKYIPSRTSKAYTQAKQRLTDGARVLFSGTPCQIAGLYSFIPERLRENLYTVEVICHGMPSKLMSDITCNHYGGGYVISYRDKTKGWTRGIHVVLNHDNERIEDTDKIFCFSEADNLSCYRCRYAQMDRVADITLGDNWNLFNQKHKYNPLGMSLVLANSTKGRFLIKRSQLVTLDFDKRNLNSPLLFMPNKYRYYLNLSRWIGSLKKNPELLERLIKHIWRHNILILPYAVLLKISRFFYKLHVKIKVSKYRKQ